MARKSQRLRRARRIERLKAREAAQNQQPQAPVQKDNSVMQAKLKEEKVEVAPKVEPTPDIVEEMIKETEELVSKVTTLQEKKEETESEGVTMAVQGEPIERVVKTAKKATTPKTQKTATKKTPTTTAKEPEAPEKEAAPTTRKTTTARKPRATKPRRRKTKTANT